MLVFRVDRNTEIYRIVFFVQSTKTPDLGRHTAAVSVFLLALIPGKMATSAAKVVVDVPHDVRDALLRWAETLELHVKVARILHEYFDGDGMTLILDHCCLSSLPVEIWQLTALTRFWCDNNHLSSLPAEIGQLTALRELNCAHNQLSSLPAEIGQLTSLRAFWCDYNQMASLPVEIGQLTALEWFGCNDNQLSLLPAEIGQLTALINFFCSGNQLTSLPPEIGQLTALAKFDCSTNQLASLPAEIGQLTALTSFVCRNNPFTKGAPRTLLALQEEDRSGRRTKRARTE